jgi:protoheme ferro-lyase
VETIMTLAAEKAYEHIGESRICSNYLHDLIHEMSRRLDALWRYDQYIANAEEHPFVQEFWNTLMQQERENVRELKELLATEIQKAWP